MPERERHLVTGAAGFVGSRLADRLSTRHEVIGVDVRPPSSWPSGSREVERRQVDQHDRNGMAPLLEGIDRLWLLGAESGGIGFQYAGPGHPGPEVHGLEGLLEAAATEGVARILFTSSAAVIGLEPGSGNHYAAAKRMAENALAMAGRDRGLDVRIARLHHVYGPGRAVGDEREGVLIALCRRIAEAIGSDSDSVEFHGSGRDRRSFLYVDDAIAGLEALMASAETAPVELGPKESHSVLELLEAIQAVAGTNLRPVSLDALAPAHADQVADAAEARRRLGWRAETTLSEGLRLTYPWVVAQVCETSA